MLDFSKREKKVLHLKLKDGVLLSVYSPSLNHLGDLSKLDLNGMEVEAMTSLLANILSNNMQKRTVNPSQIGELDIDEITVLVEAILDFVNDIKNEKN